MKLCECGCGQPAPIAKYPNRRLGHVKGEPVRFIPILSATLTEASLSGVIDAAISSKPKVSKPYVSIACAASVA